MEENKLPLKKIIIMIVLVSIFSVIVIGFLTAILGLNFILPLEPLLCAAICGTLGLRIINCSAAKMLHLGKKISIFLIIFSIGFVAYYFFAIILLMVVVALNIYRG